MFKQILAMVLGYLKVGALAKSESGKSILTADQKQMLTDKWGDKFTSTFEAELETYEAEGNEASTSNVEISNLQTQLGTIKTQLETAISEKRVLEQKVSKLEGTQAEDAAETIEMVDNSKKRIAFKPNMNYVHNKVIENYFKGDGSMQYSGDGTIDTAELQEEFGRYVTAEKVEIMKSLTSGLTCTDYMSTIVTDKLQWKASQAMIDSVLQQFTPYWTPSKKAKFTPIVIENFLLKVNQPIKPSDIIDSFFGYLYDEGTTPDQMPIVKYIIEELVKPKLLEDLEIAMVTGKFVEFNPTQDGQAAPADAATQSMNGFLTVLRELKAANAVIGGWLLPNIVLTSENIIEELNNAVDSVSKNYKKKKMFIHIDPDLVTLYKRAYLEKYKARITAEDVKDKVDFSNFTFGPIEGMQGTGAFFITPKENFKHLMSRNVNEAKVYIQVINYDVKVFMEFRKGTGFAMQEAIFAYLPAETETGSGSVGGGL